MSLASVQVHTHRPVTDLEAAEIKLAKLQLQLLKKQHQELCRTSFRAFVLYMHPEWKPAWFHFDIMATFQRVGDGSLKRVIISLPPGHAKSTYVQLFLAWFIGRFPHLQNIATSYTDELTSANTKAVQEYISSDRYREIFPISIAEQNNKKIRIAGHKTDALRSAGIMGGITGKRATGGIVIDDPVKNFKGASSENQKATLESEWQYSIRSRTQAETFVIIIMTRWRLDDFAGMRLNEAENNPSADQWEEIRFPLMKVDPLDTKDPRQVGETLWPERGYDKPWADTTKASISLEAWESIYQQNPIIIGGGILKIFNLRFWYIDGKEPPPVKMSNNDGELIEIPQIPLPPAFRTTIQSWDMTFKKTKSGSFIVGQVWGKGAEAMPAAAFLLHQVRARGDFDDACSMVRGVTRDFPNAHRKAVEEKANGPAVRTHLQGEIPGIEPYEPQGDKEERASVGAIFINAHNVYVPHPSVYPWVKDYLAELGAFPKGMNDDQVDSTTQALDILFGKANWKVY